MKKLLWFFVALFLFLLNVNVLAAQPEQENQAVEENLANRINNIKIDGIVEEGEYLKKVVYRDLEIFWSNDEKYLYMALRGKTLGYVSIGIQPGSTMKDADIILGYVQDGKVEIFDQYSTGNFGPHPSDEELGGTNDILHYTGKEEEGYTVIEFIRLLKTEDKYDQELKSGKNKIIWAYSNQDSTKGKHMVRGYGEIEINGLKH